MGLASYVQASGKCERCTYFDKTGNTCIVGQNRSEKCRHFFPNR